MASEDLKNILSTLNIKDFSLYEGTNLLDGEDNKSFIKISEFKNFSFHCSQSISSQHKLLIDTFLKALYFEKLSQLDDVTAFFNQRKLFADLKKLISKNNEFCVLFIDVDHFKKVNDHFGHLVGSKLLLDLSHVIRKNLNTEHLYRYGGDEFVLIIEDKTDKVIQTATQMSEAIKNHKFHVENHGEYELSVSTGICSFPLDAKSLEEVIEIADKMMYESKKKQRGQVNYIGKSSGEAC